MREKYSRIRSTGTGSRAENRKQCYRHNRGHHRAQDADTVLRTARKLYYLLSFSYLSNNL